MSEQVYHSTNEVHNTYNEYFPETVSGEKVSQKIKVFPFESFGKLDSLLSVMQVDHFQKQLSTEFFQG